MTIADKMNDYQILKKRQPLSIEQKDDFYSVYYGYSGEQSFAELLPAVSIVRDLHVRSISKGLAQFDIIVVHDQTVTHYDIKNYKGQFTVQNHGLTNQYGKYFKNPDDQLDRAHYILEEYVRRFNPHYQVESYVVFINEGFHFSGDNRNPKWLFRSMLSSHLQQYADERFMAFENAALCHYLQGVASPPLNINPIQRSPFNMNMKGLRCNCGTYISEQLYGKKKTYCPVCEQLYTTRKVVFNNSLELYIKRYCIFD
ncbi:NERD domain-containing protein [Macrococcus hajekii]|uniref:NERD domain-containing protein n=1 Tax=Macrococcus hajekii TaxID=198482 RepID=A0A4R6BIY9_9STAP|nr:nuclease-related domain-containing protein [Macrococcus hajekii]TDM01560.1 NERD domain-containing protein [Macrococcus hajekii]GGB00994.1 hypothetical protein GCM10007190_06350 [Macrococcus hajekii]